MTPDLLFHPQVANAGMSRAEPVGASVVTHWRRSWSLLGASLITLLLFQLMASLVRQDALITRPTSELLDVTVAAPRAERQLNPKVRQLPPPPAPVVARVPTSQLQTEPALAIGSTDVTVPAPQLAALPQSERLSRPDGDASPLVRIEPRYPAKAARDGVSGWVVLSFSIDVDGSVTDIAVIAAEPKRVFEQEAIRALKRWKYQPLILNGKAEKRLQLQVQLDFQLEQS